MPGKTARGLPYLNPSDPPDLAGATYNLATATEALSTRICDAYWGDANNEAQQMNAAAWSNMPTSAAVTDPFNMRQSDLITYKLPWDGRYSVWIRAEFTADDTAARYMLGVYNASNDTYLALHGVGPVRSQTPTSMHAEFVVPAGTLIRPRVYRDSSGNQYLRRYVGMQESQRIVIRHLAAA